MESESHIIQEIMSVETLKHKRTYQRGQITKIHKRINMLQANPLRETKNMELQQLQQGRDTILVTTQA